MDSAKIVIILGQHDRFNFCFGSFVKKKKEQRKCDIFIGLTWQIPLNFLRDFILPLHIKFKNFTIFHDLHGLLVNHDIWFTSKLQNYML